MASEILINVRPNQTRVAYVENRELRDLKIDRRTSPTIVGSIYRGKVLRVLPGMQAAFVDIGLERAAFLYVGDVRSNIDGGYFVETATDEVTETKPALDEVKVESSADETSEEEEPRPMIQDLLTEGQYLMVQVAKEPLGTKGARITTHISLPGRLIVYMPTLAHIGISRRIEVEEERERLRKIIDKITSLRGGLIVRTAGEGASETDLKNDVDYLSRIWKEIQKNYEKRKTIGLVHSELDIELRALRDILSTKIDNVIVDDKKTHKKLVNFLAQFMPQFKNIVSLYEKAMPLFDVYDIDEEISRSLERKIWLKSGGYLVIDEAEALVVVDVNTGKFVGKRDLEDTIVKTNLEAAREIAQQLRVRNCGGIIIIDFIDMEKEIHKEKVLERLQEELAKDRARTTFTSISELGLVEMTRKRIRPSLISSLCEPCSYCEGKGYLKSKATVATEIFRAIEREQQSLSQDRPLVVHCHAEIADWIYQEEAESLEHLELKIGSSVAFKTEPGFHTEQFEVVSYD